VEGELSGKKKKKKERSKGETKRWKRGGIWGAAEVGAIGKGRVLHHHRVTRRAKERKGRQRGWRKRGG